MPMITIKTVGPVSPEERGQLIERITLVMQDVLGKNPATTQVIIEEVAAENWGLGGKSVANIRAGK